MSFYDVIPIIYNVTEFLDYEDIVNLSNVCSYCRDIIIETKQLVYSRWKRCKILGCLGKGDELDAIKYLISKDTKISTI